jgi:hypothetical protein
MSYQKYKLRYQKLKGGGLTDAEKDILLGLYKSYYDKILTIYQKVLQEEYTAIEQCRKKYDNHVVEKIYRNYNLSKASIIETTKRIDENIQILQNKSDVVWNNLTLDYTIDEIVKNYDKYAVIILRNPKKTTNLMIGCGEGSGLHAHDDYVTIDIGIKINPTVVGAFLIDNDIANIFEDHKFKIFTAEAVTIWNGTIDNYLIFNPNFKNILYSFMEKSFIYRDYFLDENRHEDQNGMDGLIAYLFWNIPA